MFILYYAPVLRKGMMQAEKDKASVFFFKEDRGSTYTKDPP
jgi:hypothetical protein